MNFLMLVGYRWINNGCKETKQMIVTCIEKTYLIIALLKSSCILICDKITEKCHYHCDNITTPNNAYNL